MIWISNSNGGNGDYSPFMACYGINNVLRRKKQICSVVWSRVRAKLEQWIKAKIGPSVDYTRRYLHFTRRDRVRVEVIWPWE